MRRIFVLTYPPAEELKVSQMVVPRLIKEGTLPACQVIKHAPWVIEGKDLQLPAVQKAIWLVHEGIRHASTTEDQDRLFVDE